MKEKDKITVTYEAAHEDVIVSEEACTVESINGRMALLSNGVRVHLGWLDNGVIKKKPYRLDLKLSEKTESGHNVAYSYTNFGGDQ